MKQILIPTDFSDCANAAADFGLKLANKANAKIDFLHSLYSPVDWVRLPLEKEDNYPETKKAIGIAKAELSEWRRKAQRLNIIANQSLIFNAGQNEIFSHLLQSQCDFVIMGSHGAKGLREKLIGSNAQQFIRNANIPVLIIKKPVSNSIKNILFVSDFTDVSRDSFHFLTHFADVIEAKIDLLFVNTPDQFKESVETAKNMERIMKYCNREDSCVRNIINANSVEEGIKNFIANKPMDLIAICTHGKSGLRQLFSPSITEAIANHTELPLLSIKL